MKDAFGVEVFKGLPSALKASLKVGTPNSYSWHRRAAWVRGKDAAKIKAGSDDYPKYVTLNRKIGTGKSLRTRSKNLLDEKKGVSKRDLTKKERTTTGALVGGAAGQSAYQLSGYAPKWAIRSNTKMGYAHNKKFSEITDPKIKARKKTWEKAKKTQAKAGLSASKDPQFWRTLPKGVHGGKVLRASGWTHGGKTGVATGAAATTAGALIGIKATRKKEK